MSLVLAYMEVIIVAISVAALCVAGALIYDLVDLHRRRPR